ncbi:MAG: YhbY family RNA-binding protein [Oscillospiraceae bacterium]|jgi:RNA-binding protein|nr:YhbY family RNA-binding protein [Oscillospiraceae bacterium]
MDAKQRAELKAQANALPALFQIGKEGVTEAVASQVREGFNTRELMKVRCLLKTLPGTVQEAAEQIAAAAEAEVVMTVGGCIVLYKPNPELKEKRKAQAAKKKEQCKKYRPQTPKTGQAAAYKKPAHPGRSGQSHGFGRGAARTEGADESKAAPRKSGTSGVYAQKKTYNKNARPQRAAHTSRSTRTFGTRGKPAGEKRP